MKLEGVLIAIFGLFLSALGVAHAASYSASTVDSFPISYGYALNSALCMNPDPTASLPELAYVFVEGGQGASAGEAWLTKSYNLATDASSISEEIVNGEAYSCAYNSKGELLVSGSLAQTAEPQQILIRKRDNTGQWKSVYSYAMPGLSSQSVYLVASGDTMMMTADIQDQGTGNQTCGIFRSLDGGDTWAQVDESSAPGSNNTDCWGIVFAQDGRILVSEGYVTAQQNILPILRVSRDNGETWANQAQTIVNVDPTTLTLDPHVILQNIQGDLMGVYDSDTKAYLLVSQDQGATWSSHIIGTDPTATGTYCTSGQTDLNGDIFVSCWTADMTEQSSAQVLHSSDYGDTWDIVDNYGGTTSLSSSGMGMLIDSSGNIYYTAATTNPSQSSQLLLELRKLSVQP